MNPEYINAIRAALDNIERDPSPSTILMQCATINFSNERLMENASQELLTARSRRTADTIIDIVRTAAGQA